MLLLLLLSVLLFIKYNLFLFIFALFKGFGYINVVYFVTSCVQNSQTKEYEPI